MSWSSPLGFVTILAACVLGSGLALTGCSSASSVTPRAAGSSSDEGSTTTIGVTHYASGDRPSIPDLTGLTLDGGNLALDSLNGQVVVLNAWASYCAPCRNESPTLARVARRTAPLGVAFVGLNEQDDLNKARAFASNAGTSYPQYVDRDGAMLASLRLVPPSAIPSTLVLDRHGLVAARVIGAVDGSTLTKLVQELAGEML